MQNGPGYWMDETSGVLKPAIEAYLTRQQLSGEQILAIRAYLRQWILFPGWRGPLVDVLRTSVNMLHTREDIDTWLSRADSIQIDPL